MQSGRRRRPGGAARRKAADEALEEEEEEEEKEEEEKEEEEERKQERERKKGSRAKRPRGISRASAKDKEASAELVASRLDREQLEKYFVRYMNRNGQRALLEARALLPEHMRMRQVRALQIEAAAKPVFTSADAGMLGAFAGFPTDLIARIVRCTAPSTRTQWNSDWPLARRSEFRLSDTLRFLSACKSFKGLMSDPRFFPVVTLFPGDYERLSTIAPGIKGCEWLHFVAKKSSPPVLAKEFASLDMPNVTGITLEGQKLSKSFWTKKVLQMPLWERLRSVVLFRSSFHSYAREGLIYAIPRVFGQARNLTSLQAPYHMVASISEALVNVRFLPSRNAFFSLFFLGMQRRNRSVKSIFA